MMETGNFLNYSETVLNTAEALSIAFNNRVYDLTRAGHHITVLSLGEAFFDLPTPAMDDLPYPAVFHYSHSRGIPELRSAIARYYERNYRLEVKEDEEILITAGSKAAIYMTLLAILNRGDEVVVPEPAWVSYTEQVRLCGGLPVGIPHGVAMSEWQRFIGPKTKALILNNPHNPTGYRYSPEELRYLVDLARRSGLWLLADEAYSDFTPGGEFVSVGHYDPDKRHVVVFNSISKNYGISGWRLGYVIGERELINQVLKVNQHIVTCPATILEWYIARHFDDILSVTHPQISALLSKRTKIADWMNKIGLDYAPGDSTFYFFVSIAPSRLGSREFCVRLLEDELICAVPGIGYGQSCDSFIRISIGTEATEAIQSALGKIRALIDATT